MRGGILSHGQADALAPCIDFENFDLHHIAGLDHLVGVLDEPVGKLGDVDQAVLMHTDVDKGAEGRNIGHGPFKHHARFEIGDFLDALGKRRRLKFGSGIAAGLFEFR